MENAYAVSRFLLSGSGGQGVITMAILLAEAAVRPRCRAITILRA